MHDYYSWSNEGANDGEKGLYYNINQQKKNKKSRSKKNSTISPEAYANMEKGFPKKLKDGGKVVKGPYS